MSLAAAAVAAANAFLTLFDEVDDVDDDVVALAGDDLSKAARAALTLADTVDDRKQKRSKQIVGNKKIGDKQKKMIKFKNRQ